MRVSTANFHQISTESIRRVKGDVNRKSTPIRVSIGLLDNSVKNLYESFYGKFSSSFSGIDSKG